MQDKDFSKTKDFYSTTYSKDILSEHSLDVRYEGLRLIPSKSAADEMTKFSFAAVDCKEILERGYPAPRKRAKDTEEKWLDKKNKTYNVVVVKSFNYFYNEEVYLITHVGRFSKRKLGG